MRWFSIALVAFVQLYVLNPELVKLPMLFIHFAEHQHEEGDISFGTFLTEHYSESDHHRSGQADHENLPFHHHHGMLVDHAEGKILIAPPLARVSFPEANTGCLGARRIVSSPLNGHLSELLRPPRRTA